MRVIAGFDLETTGLLDPSQRIVEAALLLYDLDTRKRVGTFVRRFNPGRPIEPAAQAVHGISFEQVSHLPLFGDSPVTIEKIKQIAAVSEFWVGHNGIDFDLPFIRQEFTRVGHSFPQVKMVDTMAEGRWATAFGKNPNLGELCFACRISYDPALAHSAEYDVDVMMQCFFHGLDRGFYSLPEGMTLQP